MNILIKLTCLVGLAIAPILGGHGNSTSSTNSRDNIRMEVRENRFPKGMSVPPNMSGQQQGVQSGSEGSMTRSANQGTNNPVNPSAAGGGTTTNKPTPEQRAQMEKMLEERKKQQKQSGNQPSTLQKQQ